MIAWSPPIDRDPIPGSRECSSPRAMMRPGRKERERSVTCSHFETVADDVLAVYKQVTGEHLDLNVDRNEDEEEE